MMTRWLWLIALVACDRDRAAPRARVQGSAVAIPDVTTIDWRNREYELASLGTVKVVDGRAEFALVETDDGIRAGSGSSTARGALVLAPAHYTDLDGDGHDEALIPFEMRQTTAEDAQHVFGVFAFTLREGEPMRLGVVTSPTVVEVDGAAIVASDPPRRWRFVRGTGFVTD